MSNKTPLKRPSELKIGDSIKVDYRTVIKEPISVVDIRPDTLYGPDTMRVYFSDNSGWSFTDKQDNDPMWDVVDVVALCTDYDRLASENLRLESELRRLNRIINEAKASAMSTVGFLNLADNQQPTK